MQHFDCKVKYDQTELVVQQFIKVTDQTRQTIVTKCEHRSRGKYKINSAHTDNATKMDDGRAMFVD